MPTDPFGELGEYLTGSEATGLAALFEAGQHTTQALREVGAPRRERAAELLRSAELSHADAPRTVAVLRAIAGAKALRQDITPVWTMPGNEATIGHLTSEFDRLVLAARVSVTCATYNFERTSRMWTVLAEASEQPGVVVTVYLDGDKADAAAVKAQLPKATVYRSGTLPDGTPVVSHAKFVIIDHTIVLLTSANLSYSAEHRNIELGLLLQIGSLAAAIESAIRQKSHTLYERVTD